tara:strand:- start:7 stop:1071 length:1065 start_codon:yes stop_codon:yes gene_type:complete
MHKNLIIILSIILFVCCDSTVAKKTSTHVGSELKVSSNERSKNNKKGMVLVQGGEFMMGGDGPDAKQDELPKHKVLVNSFWMDESEVTNDQFQEFIDATGYVTTAEKPIDWNEIKDMLPPGTPKPHDSLLAPSSLIFFETKTEDLTDFTQWWKLKRNTNWKQPFGENSTINEKGNHPVIHISWDDAQEYCNWAGKRLPTEAEFEYASRGGLENNLYSWGNEPINKGILKANVWEGKFPSTNKTNDNFYYTAPVKSFEPNQYGLYDMAGNVWEWCSDWYHYEYYNMVASDILKNPTGPSNSYDPMEPYSPKKVIRGGSFLCNDSYCSGFRNSMRMKSTADSSSLHTGFRTVMDVQ